MNPFFEILDRIERELVKNRIDANPYTNYYQKATAKALVDGPCDSNIFSQRVNKYFCDYAIKELIYYAYY